MWFWLFIYFVLPSFFWPLVLIGIALGVIQSIIEPVPYTPSQEVE